MVTVVNTLFCWNITKHWRISGTDTNTNSLIPISKACQTWSTTLFSWIFSYLAMNCTISNTHINMTISKVTIRAIRRICWTCESERITKLSTFTSWNTHSIWVWNCDLHKLARICALNHTQFGMSICPFGERTWTHTRSSRRISKLRTTLRNTFIMI